MLIYTNSGTALNGRLRGDDGNSGGWGEDEVGGGQRNVFFEAGEGELGGGAVGLFQLQARDGAGGSDDEGEQMDALGHVFRHACDAKVRAVGRGGDLVEFLAELSVAEQKAQGGTQVVELLGRRARDLRIAGGVEPGEAAVQDEELAGG